MLTYSNINIAENEEYVYEFTESPFLQMVLETIDKSQFDDACREAFWCICNMIESSSTELRIVLVKKYNLAARLADMLKLSKDSPKLSKIVLISIDKILSVSNYILDEDENPRVCFELAGGVDI